MRSLCWEGHKARPHLAQQAWRPPSLDALRARVPAAHAHSRQMPHVSGRASISWTLVSSAIRRGPGAWGRTGECGMGEERQWPREASCSGPRKEHASPRGHPALGCSSWGRLLAQVAQGPGENAPLCIQGLAPRISGLSAWAPQAGGPPERRGEQAPGIWLPACLCD